MRSLKNAASSQNAKDIAGWTHASMLTVGSSLRSAGSNIYSNLKTGYEQLTAESADKERITFLKFGRLECQSTRSEDTSLLVLLLGYEIGFQIWLLTDEVKEIVSRRDHRIRCIETLPLPREEDRRRCPFVREWPLIAIVVDARSGEEGTKDDEQSSGLPVSQLKLYSLASHSYIRSISIPGKVLSLQCSPRILILAMSSQIMAYDLATLTVTYSAITQPAPVMPQAGFQDAQGIPIALGARWLAHASNQAVQTASGVAVGQRIASGAQASPAGSNMEVMQHYAGLAAKSSGKHIKNLGEAGYKYLSAQMENWRSSSSCAPSSPSSSSTTIPDETEVSGTVIIRDMVDRSTLAHFRAHTSPLLLLQFDASGTLLVTASVHGHTVNVYHISGPARRGEAGTALHLFRLNRGMTPAVIQGVAFSSSGRCLSVSSARGTTHVFKLSLPDKAEGVPPFLAAACMKHSERKAFHPVRLNAVGRARGTSILNGGLPGSAAASAAVNLYNGSQGASLIASTFVQRTEAASESSEGQEWSHALEDDLLVIQQSGTLTQYHCLALPLPQAPKSPEPNLASPRPLPNGKRPDSSQPELSIQPVEHFELCRKRSWPEREDFDFAGKLPLDEVEDGQPAVPWSAYAETGSLLPDVQPLWADSQFHILEMQTGSQEGSHEAGHRLQDTSRGNSAILQVEELPTKSISLQSRAGLAPVIIEGTETAVLRGRNFHASLGQKNSS